MITKLYGNVVKSIGFAVSILILLGALQSKILDWSGFSGLFIMALALVVLALSLLVLFFNEKLRKVWAWGLARINVLFWILLTGVAIVQIVVFVHIGAIQMNDAWILQMGVKDPSTIEWYLSRYPNNQLLFFLEYGISKVSNDFGSVMQIINLIVVDLSVVLVMLLGRILTNNREVGYFSGIFSIFFLGIQPVFLLVYTDTLSLLPMLAGNILILLAIKSKHIGKIIVLSILGGVLSGLAYEFRPSTAIFAIALGVIAIVSVKKSNYKAYLLSFLGTIAGAMVIVTLITGLESRQSLVKINHNEAFPMSSWILVGSSGNEQNPDGWHGAFNSKDVLYTAKVVTKENATELIFSRLINRFKDKGLSAMLKLYFLKFRDTTDTGVVGFHRDGLWLNGTFSKESFKLLIQNVFNENGAYRKYFNFFLQLLYIPMVLLLIRSIAIGRYDNPSFLFVLTTFLGGGLFLMVFESGGTKYLIQYLPYWSVLMAMGLVRKSEKALDTNTKSM